MTACTIDFEPVGRRGECQKNESLLACARRLGVGISSICGGEGTCHACKIQVLSGNVSKPTHSERDAFTSQELKDGWRLACQAYPAGDSRVMVSAEAMTTSQRLQVEGQEIRVRPEPSVEARRLKLTAPSLSAPQADAGVGSSAQAGPGESQLLPDAGSNVTPTKRPVANSVRPPSSRPSSRPSRPSSRPSSLGSGFPPTSIFTSPRPRPSSRPAPRPQPRWQGGIIESPD